MAQVLDGFFVEYYREDYVPCTALVSAVFHSNLSEVKKLLSSATVNQQDSRGRTALEWSLEVMASTNPPHDQSEILSLLLRHHPDPFLNPNERNGCFEFVYKGPGSLIADLLMRHYSTDALLSMDAKRELALKALNSGNFETYKKLTEAWKIPAEKTSSLRSTELHKACLLGSLPAVETTLKTGSDINALNELGQSSLDIVEITKRGSPDDRKKIAALLKSNGAKNNYLSVNEFIDIPIYTKLNTTSISPLETPNCKHPSTAFIRTVYMRPIDKALETIAQESDIDQRDLLGANALFWAIYRHCVVEDSRPLIQALIARGAKKTEAKHDFMGSASDLIQHFKIKDLDDILIA